MKHYSSNGYSSEVVMVAVAAAGMLLWWLEAPVIVIGLAMAATKMVLPERQPQTELEAEADEITDFLVEKI